MGSPDRADQPSDSDVGCFKALCIGVPLGLGLWAVLGVVVWLLFLI